MVKVEKGDVVRFHYNKSGERSNRLVKVENVDGQHIAGLDVFANGYRNFKRSNITHLDKVAKKYDDILPLQSDLLDTITGYTVKGEDMARTVSQVYKNIYSDVRYVKDLDVLVMTPNNNIAVKFDNDSALSGRRSVTLISKGHQVSIGIEDSVLSKVWIDGEEVGSDINGLIGALEVLADE